MAKRNKVRSALHLGPRDVIVTAWAEGASGPGWQNRPLWVLVMDGDKQLRRECIQPAEQTADMHTLYRLSEEAHRAMAGAVEEAIRG